MMSIQLAAGSIQPGDEIAVITRIRKKNKAGKLVLSKKTNDIEAIVLKVHSVTCESSDDADNPIQYYVSGVALNTEPRYLERIPLEDCFICIDMAREAIKNRLSP